MKRFVLAMAALAFATGCVVVVHDGGDDHDDRRDDERKDAALVLTAKA